MFQFSLRNLLIAVAFCAMAAAALVNANAWWVAIAWSMALFSVTAAALLAIHRREEKRAFWGGFALLGSLYLLLLMYSIQPVSSSNSSVLCLEPLSYFNLLTTKLSNWSYSLLPAVLTTEYLPGAGVTAPVGGGGMPGMPGGGMPATVNSVRPSTRMVECLECPAAECRRPCSAAVSFLPAPTQTRVLSTKTSTLKSATPFGPFSSLLSAARSPAGYSQPASGWPRRYCENSRCSYLARPTSFRGGPKTHLAA